MASLGESKTRCNAIVNSTTPRFGPKCPPVFETLEIKNSLISRARAGNCAAESFFKSWGELIEFKRPIEIFLLYF